VNQFNLDDIVFFAVNVIEGSEQLNFVDITVVTGLVPCGDNNFSEIMLRY